MKNMKKKGFTLVELLVVIAIIAILAAVSVVGYTAFISKANQSNAMTELSQIKDAVYAAVLDGEESVKLDNATTVTLTYDGTKLTATVTTVETETDAEGKETTKSTTSAASENQIKDAMLKLTEMTLGKDQTFEVNVDATNKNVTTVVYTYAKDATATWTVSTGEVK